MQLNEEITQQEEQAENIDRFISKVHKYLDLDELTPAIRNDMATACTGGSLSAYNMQSA